ncbi:MAG: hypothetical protein IPM24_14395 [Bryobacterales bacterium]|nr:hypothetical protein [Bryobacterales bacterium]
MPRLPALLLLAASLWGQQALVQDRTHDSEVLNETRNYRIFLPPGYGESDKRYPVIYWFHGHSERYNKPPANRPNRNYDQGEDYGGNTIAAFVARNDVIVVKWDGYNPRTPDEQYPRPYNISPVETGRQFPFYFRELVDYVDASYRTIPDREHRATAGLSMGGFMSYWVSGMFPHLVGSASNFMGSTEFVIGPRSSDVEYRHEEMHGNYEGLYTRLVTGSLDFIRFYHRRLNAIWRFTRDHHETEDFEFDHGTPGMAKTLEFHMKAFANPLPRPAQWSHANVYPAFKVWDWEVMTDRRRPGYTWLENVSRLGFRSSVRERLPDGKTLDGIRIDMVTAPHYPAGETQVVTRIRLRDGEVSRESIAADPEGRLSLVLDGEAYEVGIGAGPVLALAGHTLDGAAWVKPRQPARVKARFWNKGGARSPATPIDWTTGNPSVAIKKAKWQVPPLDPGAQAEVPLEFSVFDETHEIVKLTASGAGQTFPLVLRVFPDAPVAAEARISDGRAFPVYQRATEVERLELGDGNADGQVNAGEQFAVLFPDGDGFRAAELFGEHPCLDLSFRVSDRWGRYDNVGATSKYTLPSVKPECAAGTELELMARVLWPDKPEHRLTYHTVRITVAAKP